MKTCNMNNLTTEQVTEKLFPNTTTMNRIFKNESNISGSFGEGCTLRSIRHKERRKITGKDRKHYLKNKSHDRVPKSLDSPCILSKTKRYQKVGHQSYKQCKKM